jgi:hypothetical protein
VKKRLVKKTVFDEVKKIERKKELFKEENQKTTILQEDETL